MRILHTADWHVGKKLGRIDRSAELGAAFDEIVGIAKEQKVDLVIVAGDLFDRAAAPLESIALVVDVLTRLAEAGGHVIAMPGNHDSQPLFGLLAPLLRPRAITLVPKIVRPEDGGVIEVPARSKDEAVSVGVFPFLNEAQVVDFMADSEDWFKSYAHKIRLICHALCEGFKAQQPGILTGHFFIDKAELGGGERLVHIGDQYAATAQSIPPAASYVALGHIHRPQAIADAAVPTRYAGSILQLDFSERTHNKEVVIIEAVHGKPAKVRSIQLASGRKLLRVEDELDNLKRRVDEFADAYLDVRVKTSGPVFGLAEEVHKFLPDAVMVQAVYERMETTALDLADGEVALVDAYDAYHRIAHKAQAPDELIELVRELEQAVILATG